VKIYKMSTISRSLALFLESGFTMIESLSTVSSHEQNPSYRKALEEISLDLKRGGSFSSALKKHGDLFSSEAVQFSSIGEESGSLAKTLSHLAAFYQEELVSIEKSVLSLMEPAIMLILGAIVGFVALSLITPIYSMTSLISS